MSQRRQCHAPRKASAIRLAAQQNANICRDISINRGDEPIYMAGMKWIELNVVTAVIWMDDWEEDGGEEDNNDDG